MPRRRLTLGQYVARRWRVLGLVLVLTAGSLLVLAVTDRGHDPGWSVRPGSVDSAALAPDGSFAYALIRDEGNITRLEARRGVDGSLAWESPVQAPRALLQAGPDGVVVATDFPRAFLTYYATDGDIRFQVPLQGNPRAISVEGTHVALALQAPGNPVLVFREGTIEHVHRFAQFVNSLEIRSGRLGVGTGSGQVSLFAPNGTMMFNASFPMSVRSLAMSGDGLAVVVGGDSLDPGDFSGFLAFVDLAFPDPIRWTQPTGAGVGLVDLERNGLWAMAILESPPRYTVQILETGTGRARWAHPVDGTVARDDSGSLGGAALSPDGRHVAVGTLRDGIVVRDVRDGRTLWRYDAEGTTLVTYARENTEVIAANGRLVQNGPYDTLLLFRVTLEPWTGQIPSVAMLIVVAGIVGGALVLGYGYWRARRSY